MGCGCATIATGLPAVQDIISDEITGKLIREKNSGDISIAVSELLDKPDLKKKLSFSGRKYVEDNFDWPVIASAYMKLIDTMPGISRLE
jgi:glycosyltransferase involved in cell wall biosynthesis